jgi:hypothetical protein
VPIVIDAAQPPEEQGVMGVIALVRQVSRVLDAPHVPRGLAPPAESKGGGGRRPRPRSCNSYSTVLLELVRLDEPRPSHASDMECVAPWLIYLVLVDEEVYILHIYKCYMHSPTLLHLPERHYSLNYLRSSCRSRLN